MKGDLALMGVGTLLESKAWLAKELLRDTSLVDCT